LLFVSAVVAVPVQHEDDSYTWYEFGKFTHQYAKNYNGLDEFHSAFANFKANLHTINTHNAGKSSYTLGINEFADMTFEQFAAVRLGYKPSTAPRTAEIFNHTNVTPANDIDWRQRGAVGPVKNQGQCGSCWAFSAVASLEGAHALSGKGYASLSEQQLVDCSTSYGNNGCNGGLMDNAFRYLIAATAGDDSEAAYPYRGVDGACAYSPSTVAATIRSFTDVAAANEAALIAAVSSVGPVSVAIQAASDFMLYSGGVYDSTQCSSSPSTLNHGVAVVGYTADAIIVRNSWGASWGEAGYIRMARGKNMCGIADVASFPVV